MEKRIELWVFPTGNVAVYRGSAFIPTEQLTEEERLFVLDRVCDELKGKIDLDAEIKKYTESLYNETFGNGQGTLDEFDGEDISTVIEDTARHFHSLRPSWKPDKSLEEEITRYGKEEMPVVLESGLNDIARHFYELGQQSRPKISDNSLEEEIAGMYQALFGTDIINRKEMLYLETFNAIARHFAEWQKSQMLKEAIHYVVQDDLDSHGASYNIPFIRLGSIALESKGIGVGDKVSCIIVKEEE